MWAITDRGFVSLVEDRDDGDMLHVRARVKADITALFEGAEVLTTHGADYRWRAIIPRERVAKRLHDAVMEIRYTSHFKDVAVTRSAGDQRRRHAAYYQCWEALAELSPYAPYALTPRVWAGKK